MIEIWWSPEILNMLIIELLRPHVGTKFGKKIKNRKFPNFFAFPKHKNAEANNNREAVVVCARHVVKRPTKDIALVYFNCI